MARAAVSRVNWPKFLFFTKDVIEENIVQLLDAKPTCGVAEGGIILFGDENGFIHISDRNLQLSDESKYKVFRGAVYGIAYINDYYSSPPKRYIITIGDDSISSSSSATSSNMATTTIPISSYSSCPHYVIKILSTRNMHRPLHFFSAMSGVPAGASLSAFTVMIDGTQIALGFSTGTVSVFVGPFVKDVSSSNSINSSVKSNSNANTAMMIPQISIRQQPYPVSNLHFAEIPIFTSSSGTNSNSARMSVGGNPSLSSATATTFERRIHLFVVMDTNISSSSLALSSTDSSVAASVSNATESSAGIFSLDTSVTVPLPSSSTSSLTTFSASDSTHSQSQLQLQWLSSNRRPPQFLDDEGAQQGCASYMSDTRELVVGRQEGVFSYTVEDRGGAAGLEGHKQRVHCIDKYVLIVSSSGNNDTTTTAASAVASTGAANNKEVVTIYDLRNKFIAASIQLSAGESIQMVLYDKGTHNGYIVTSYGQVLKLKEKSSLSKSLLLMNKSLYPLAITLAAENQLNVMELMNLYSAYAQFLYHRKQEYEQAILQYCHTIGYLPSSTVIPLFLEPSKLMYLVVYLEKLHEKGLAHKDHTTLLLTCYIQLKQVDKVKLFVDTNDKAVYPLPLSQPLPLNSSSHNNNNNNNNNTRTSTATATSGMMNNGVPDGHNHNNRFKKLADIDEYSFDASTAVSLLLKASEASAESRVDTSSRSQQSASNSSSLYVDLAYILALRHKCYRQCAEICIKYRRTHNNTSNNTNNNDTTVDGPADAVGVFALITALLFDSDNDDDDHGEDKRGKQHQVPYSSDIRHILLTYYKDLLHSQPVLFISFLVNLCLRKYNKLIDIPSTAGTTAITAAAASAVKAQMTRAEFLSTLPPIILSQSVFYFFSSSNNSNNNNKSDTQSKSHQQSHESTSSSSSSQWLLLLFVESLVTELLTDQAFINSALVSTLFELYLSEYAAIATQLSITSSSSSPSLSNRCNNNTDDKNITTSTTTTTSIKSTATYITQLENKLVSLSSKALSLLQYENADYDCNQMLLVCTIHDFRQGKLYLLEKMNDSNNNSRYSDTNDNNHHSHATAHEGNGNIRTSSFTTASSSSSQTQLLLRLRIESGDDKGLLQLLRQQSNGSSSSGASGHYDSSNNTAELYTQVLRYFLDKEMTPSSSSSSSSRLDGSGRWDSLSEVLMLVQQEGVLSPMQILSLLSSNPQVPYHLVSSYMRHTIGQSTVELSQVHRDIHHVQQSINQAMLEKQHQQQQSNAQQQLQQLELNEDIAHNNYHNKRTVINSSSSTNPFDDAIRATANPFDDDDDENADINRAYINTITSTARNNTMTSTNPFNNDDDDATHDRKDSQSIHDHRNHQQQQQQRQKWQDIRQGLLQSSGSGGGSSTSSSVNHHEAFFAELDQSGSTPATAATEGFSMVARYLGKQIILLDNNHHHQSDNNDSRNTNNNNYYQQ